jgi:putative ATP-binding cassette transporter
MKLFRYLLSESWREFVATILRGVLRGVGSAVVIALIQRKLRGAESREALYGLAVVLSFLADIASRWIVLRLSTRSFSRLQIDLSRRLLAAPLSTVESMGSGRVYGILTSDIATITELVAALPPSIISLATTIAVLWYILWLSPKLFACTMGAVAVGAGVQLVLGSRGNQNHRRARVEQDVLFGHYAALTGGTKELRINVERRTNFLAERLEPTVQRMSELRAQAIMNGATISALFGMLLDLILGGVVFLGVRLRLADNPTVQAYTVALLFVNLPMLTVLYTLPVIQRVSVVIKRITDLGVSLSSSQPLPDQAPRARPFEGAMELTQVTHTYRAERDDRPFILGPIDLQIRAGEMIFVVGGNGSGKTTMAKIIAGLYPPERGTLRLAGQEVDDNNRMWYQQHISAVFADFHLFENVLGRGESVSEVDARAQRYLQLLQLDRKVQLQNGVFSTVNLSQGQRKRLALLSAYMEDRPIYLFDEWASDQDPLFKEIFYRQLLPELKAAGKTLIVITHDDSYFGVADRVIRLESGRLTERS